MSEEVVLYSSNNTSNAAKQRAAAEAMFVQHNAERQLQRNKDSKS